MPLQVGSIEAVRVGRSHIVRHLVSWIRQIACEATGVLAQMAFLPLPLPRRLLHSPKGRTRAPVLTWGPGAVFQK